MISRTTFLSLLSSSLNNAPFLRTGPVLRRSCNIRPSRLPRTYRRIPLSASSVSRLVSSGKVSSSTYIRHSILIETHRRTARERKRETPDCQRIGGTNERRTQERPKFIRVDDSESPDHEPVI